MLMSRNRAIQFFFVEEVKDVSSHEESKLVNKSKKDRFSCTLPTIGEVSVLRYYYCDLE